MMNSGFIWFGIPIALGFALFHLKYKVQTGEEHLKGIHRHIVASYDDLMVLESEWGLLNTPTKLADLNTRYFKLGPVKVPQIVTLDGLPMPTKVEEPVS